MLCCSCGLCGTIGLRDLGAPGLTTPTHRVACRSLLALIVVMVVVPLPSLITFREQPNRKQDQHWKASGIYTFPKGDLWTQLVGFLNPYEVENDGRKEQMI